MALNGSVEKFCLDASIKASTGDLIEWAFVEALCWTVPTIWLELLGVLVNGGLSFLLIVPKFLSRDSSV